MKTWIDALDKLAPPSWLLLSLAALLAASLLAAFVDTLQLNLRNGEEMRQNLRRDQRVSALRQTISTVADATPIRQQPQLR